MTHRSLENSIREILLTQNSSTPVEGLDEQLQEDVDHVVVEEVETTEQVEEQNCGCGQDPCKTYGKVDEKTLTPAEKKKREDVAKAIERDNPDMPMDKKMAIATATAKKVAESSISDRTRRLIERAIKRNT